MFMVEYIEYDTDFVEVSCWLLTTYIILFKVIYNRHSLALTI
jgi:hypothetical protein